MCQLSKQNELTLRNPGYMRWISIVVSAGALAGAVLELSRGYIGPLLPIALVGVVGAAQVVRGRVTVDEGAGLVSLGGVLRTREVHSADIERVRVPAWGPVSFVLRRPQRRAWGLISREARSGVSVDSSVMRQTRKLAEILDLPVGSPWPQARREGESSDSVGRRDMDRFWPR